MHRLQILFIHTLHLRTEIKVLHSTRRLHMPLIITARLLIGSGTPRASHWPIGGADMTLIVTSLQDVLSEFCEGRISVIVFIVSRVCTLIYHQ